MDLNNYEVRVFKTIIESNGFKKASENLFITQSAVSQCLSNLENKLGLELIIRKSPLQLTESGKRLLNYAHNVLNEEKEILEELNNIKNGIDITLSIALNNTINRFYAPELLQKFCTQHPSAKLKIDNLPSRELIYAILAGKKELGIGPFQKQMAAFETIPLFEAKRYLVVSKHNPHYQMLLKNPKEAFKKMPLLTSYLDEPDMRPSVEKIRDQFATVWEMNSERLRLALVKSGFGVTFMGNKLFEDPVESQELEIVKKSPFGMIDRMVGIYYKKNIDLSVGAKSFIRICKDYWKYG